MINKHSLIFKVADLLIQFYCKSEDDATFLKDKYANFLVKRSNSAQLAGRVFFDKERSKEIQIKEDDIYISHLPLSKEFGKFNIFFEIAMMPILGRNNGFILHASSLVKNGLGYIFTGKEDRGKSTIIKLFSELVCLGDDTAIIRKVDNHFFLFSSPFYQRNYKPEKNLKVLVRTIFALTEIADFNLVKPLFFPDDFKALLSNAYISEMDTEDKEKELLARNCYEFCLKNKIFSLSFKKNRSFWPLLEKIIQEC